jgi:hypothetical protein
MKWLISAILITSCSVPKVITPEIPLPQKVCETALDAKYTDCIPVPQCDYFMTVLENEDPVTIESVLNMIDCQYDREAVYKDAYLILRALIESVNKER